MCLSLGRFLARPAGLEPATPSLEGSCSIQLNYGRALTHAIAAIDRLGNGVKASRVRFEVCHGCEIGFRA